MPRRTGIKCQSRLGGPALVASCEWGLLYGVTAGGIGPDTPELLQAAWTTHGPAMLEHFVKYMPGSRPWPQYLLGEIPPLPEVSDPLPSDKPFPFGGCNWWQSDRVYGKHGPPEVNHLLTLGIITRAEASKAAGRLKLFGGGTKPYPWLSPPGG